MRKFADMIPLLLSTIAAFLLAQADSPIAIWALCVAIAGLALSIILALLRGWDWWMKGRPGVTLIIENVNNPYYPEHGTPKCNLFFIHLVLKSELTVLDSYPLLLDNKGRSMSWSTVNPEDWNGTFDRDESPVRILVESLALEQGSETVRAKIYFNGKRFPVKSNKLNCEELLRFAEGVRRKKLGEKNDDYWEF